MERAPRDSVVSVGEFALIDRLRRLVPTSGPGVMVGLGDDAAVLTFAGSVVATCDIQVEGVHFTWALCAPGDVGWRAVAVNLSDLAAMGGTPRFVLISMALPPETPVGVVENLYRGVAEISASHAVVVAGGNLSSTSGPLVIDVTALGDAGRPLRRAGARPGDRVWVTGEVGKAAAGRFLAGHPGTGVPGRDALVAAYRRPTPRVEAGRLLGGAREVSAMIDTSDGTAIDLLHVVEASRAGVRLDAQRLPVQQGLIGAAQEAGCDPAAWMLEGGEDYELVFTAAQEFDAQAPGLASRLAVPLTCIGEILPQAEGRWILDRDGHRRPLEPQGWDHFPHRR
jgi:thiamine-monophosphate kinase